jgi:hypothetical protein
MSSGRWYRSQFELRYALHVESCDARERRCPVRGRWQIDHQGRFDADALGKAALEVDLPEGGTMLGFGVKFGGEETNAAGQNDRAFPVIIQYIDDKSYVVWPKSLQTREPVLPLPVSSPYAER